MFRTGHLDLFARDHLPRKELQPDLIFDRPEVRYPERLNAAVELLDRNVEEGNAERIVLRTDDAACTYRQLQHQVNRIAHVLRNDMSLVPGNRVLLRGANNPMMAACFLAVLKAGLIAVPTMPLLRAKELHTDPREGERHRCAVRHPPQGRTGGGAGEQPAAAGALLQRRRRHHAGRRFARSHLRRAAARVPGLRHRAGRHLPDRLHLGHDRPAQGHDAHASRRHGDVRPVPALDPQAREPTTSSAARRRSPSPSASAACCAFRCASARRCC